ncbi:MAG: hypothetical protein IDH49_03495 [Gammaproteobacteria bacterium]|nr:hypothetical protein [Gammaproteobacteria bacterium]
MYNIVKRLSAFLLIAALAGCGGGDDAFKGAGTDTGTGTGTGTGTPTVQMSLTIGVTTLSAGGSASVTAKLTDAATGAPYATETEVTFTSVCAGTQAATLISPVKSANGVAISTYVAKGCEGTDTITATATINSNVLTATGVINVQPAVLGSIQFVSATPSSIALKGTGGAGLSETSTIVFKVLNSVGGVVPNKDVTFSLDTDVGGLSLSPLAAKTDANGQAQTVVQAGTIPTPVRVTATIVGTSPVISTQSDQLAITTGIPDQDSISLSAETLNPEAWRIDGVTVKITARLADRFNNPVPDGTAVTFTTEGGLIGGSCTTVKSACSVDWVSQNPRPSDGRVTILATVIGEESFVDANNDGYFGDGDSFPAINDLPEAFRDDNENGVRDATEFSVDFNRNLLHDAADGKFNGILCSHSTLCGSTKTLNVRDSAVLVMSDTFANVVITPSPGINVAAGPQTVTITVGSLAHNQPMPRGTTIAIATDNGKLSGRTSYTVGNINANGPLVYGINVATDGTSSSGALTVTVTAPSGEKSSASINVQD